MNKISPEKEALIDRMICEAYPIRVISEVAEVSRNTIQVRRNPMVWHRGFWFVYCPCGKPVIDPDTEHFHDQEPCARRSRRNRLLLRLVRNRRWNTPDVAQDLRRSTRDQRPGPAGKGGKARAESLTAQRRQEIAKKAAKQRWKPHDKG